MYLHPIRVCDIWIPPPRSIKSPPPEALKTTTRQPDISTTCSPAASRIVQLPLLRACRFFATPAARRADCPAEPTLSPHVTPSTMIDFEECFGFMHSVLIPLRDATYMFSLSFSMSCIPPQSETSTYEAIDVPEVHGSLLNATQMMPSPTSPVHATPSYSSA